MKFNIITLFPEMFEVPLSKGVVGQNIFDGKLDLNLVNIRDYSDKKFKHVDDRPFGGGDGMVIMAEPLEKAITAAKPERAGRIVYLTPQGQKFTDKKAREYSELEELTLVCGRYGGIDERVIQKHVDEEISIGDYVLSGGEVAALVVVDAVARLIPGVLGNEESKDWDSFSGGLLEGPLYTRPRIYKGMEVPEILLSGDHGKIARYRRAVSILRTKERRPDLIEKALEQGILTKEELSRAQDLLSNLGDGPS